MNKYAESLLSPIEFRYSHEKIITFFATQCLVWYEESNVETKRDL
jgi:hypothetical protein